jgi:hypothetical protein
MPLAVRWGRCTFAAKQVQEVVMVARSGSKTNGSTKAKNEVLDMLKQDHKKAKKAFGDFEKLGPDDTETCAAIVERTCAELEVHAALEEELFYPAIHAAIREPGLVDEAEVEHKSLKMLIQDLDGLEPGDEKYAASFKVLAEYTRHHIKEEEGEIFEQLARAKVDWEGLLQEMQQRRAELLEERGLEDEEAAVEAAGQ